ncbi:MAG: hypothetical protein KF805_16045 [Phycisphaeraceae bacterium]|nr:hypothetical protein [Phycisphaeraceae bacterium]
MLSATKKAGWFAVAIMAGMTIPVFLLWFAFPRFGGQMVVMTVFFFMMFYGHEIAKWVVLRRIVRQLWHHEGAVCTRCVYPIGESMVMCPECGKVENAERARRDWLATGLWLPESLVTPASAATSSPANP